MAAHLFRNVRISSINTTAQEAGVVVRVHVRSEIMPDVAEAFGWEVIHDGNVVGGLDGTTGLAGQLALQKATFQPNGMRQHNVAIDASEARDFKVVVKGKNDDDNDGEAELRFIIVLPAASCEAIIRYFLVVGAGDAVMRLHTSAENASLFDEEQTKAQDGPEQTLASAQAMGGKRKPKVQ